MATVARLDVQIGADIKQFQRGMSQMENQLKQVGSNLRGVGRTLSTAVTLPILGIAGAAVKAASDVEEMRDKFNVVFKTVGGSVTKELGNFAKQVNRSRYDLMGFAATFGDIIKPMGFTEESAANMSVTLTKLAVDLSSFNNMPMDEAVRRLRGTLIGAHENAADFGVIINENTLKQELMRMGAENLTGSQKEQAKVQARLNLLLKGTTDAHGNAADTAGTFAGQMRGLVAATRDLGIQIGEMLLPYATELVGTMRGLVERFQAMSPEAKKTVLALVGFATAIGPVLFILGGMASGFSAIIGAMSTLVALANPVVLGFAAIAAIGIAVYRNWDAVKGAFVGTWDAISGLLDNLKSQFVTVFQGIFKAAAQAVTGDFSGAFETLKSTVSTGASNVVSEVNTFATDVGAAVAPAVAAFMFDPFAIGDFFEEGLAGEIAAFFTGAKNNAKASLDTDEDSMSKSADAAKVALENIRKEVGNIEGLAPSFLTLENALAGAEVSSDDVDTALNKISTQVGNIEGLAPDFGTLTKALGSETLADESLLVMAGNASAGVKGIGDEVTALESIAPDFKAIKKSVDEEVKTPAQKAKEEVEAFIDNLKLGPEDLRDVQETAKVVNDFIPTTDEVSRFYQLQHAFGLLTDDLKDAGDDTSNFAHHFGRIEGTLKLLKVDEDSKFFKLVEGVRYAAEQTTIFVEGMESLIELMKAETWINFFETIVGVIQGLGTILGITGSAVGDPNVTGGTPPDFTGGDPGIDIPGSGGQGTPTGVPVGTGGGGVATAGGAATAAGGGAFGAGIPLASALALAYVFGRGIYQLAGFGGSETPWVTMGMTRDEWISQAIATGGFGLIAGNLMGGVDLSWLSGTAGGASMNGAGTPSWLSGLQGYMGSGGAANTSGFMGSGTMGSMGQIINVNLDGQTIATATVPYLANELEVFGTNY